MKFTPEQVIEMAEEAGFRPWRISGDSISKLCTLAADRALEAVNSAVQSKAVAVTAANSHRGKINSAAAFAVGILDDVSDAIRAMKEHQ